MAIIHQASLVPSKLEALAGWLPGRPWAGDTGELTQVGSYRFDDPAGAVGIEVLLVRGTGGRVLQVPLTYRSAPLPGAEDALVTTMEHSVLGPRWVYDGCADPVAVAALVGAVLTGAHGAVLDHHRADGTVERREPTVRVAGSGTPGTAVPPVDAVHRVDTASATVVTAAGLELTVRRVLDAAADQDGHVLRGSWAGTSDPVVLVSLRLHAAPADRTPVPS